jgi:hypothetical protein
MAPLRPRRRRPLLVVLGLGLACGVFLRAQLPGPGVTGFDGTWAGTWFLLLTSCDVLGRPPHEQGEQTMKRRRVLLVAGVLVAGGVGGLAGNLLSALFAVRAAHPEPLGSVFLAFALDTSPHACVLGAAAGGLVAVVAWAAEPRSWSGTAWFILAAFLAGLAALAPFWAAEVNRAAW